MINLNVSQHRLDAWATRPEVIHWIQQPAPDFFSPGDSIHVRGSNGAGRMVTVVQSEGHWAQINFCDVEPVGNPNEGPNRLVHYSRFVPPKRQYVANDEVMVTVLEDNHVGCAVQAANAVFENRFGAYCWDCDVLILLPAGMHR